VLPAAAAGAAGGEVVTVAPAAEGWHRTAPTCALPTGCPEAPSPYAPDTLHVGVNLGAEEARTTLLLDLAALPAGSKPVGGQLRLPVSTGPQDGTRNPEAAKILACVVIEPVADVDGSFAPPPEADCNSASVEAVFSAATGDEPAALTVDLAPLAPRWQDFAVPGALALVPGVVARTDTWHVAFSDRTREGADVGKVTAAVSFVPLPGTDPQPPPSTPLDVPAETGVAVVPDFDVPEAPFTAAGPALEVPVSLPEPAAQAPAVAAPAPQAAPAQAVPVASLLDAGFRYPAVFLLPLLLALVFGWLGRALTRDLAAPA
jgi:hypothetical protein